MLYKFDKNALVFRKVKWLNGGYYLLLAVVIFLMTINISAKTDSQAAEDKIMVILAERNHFTSEKLISKIKEMHFQFPYIVFGQALLESSHFKSRIFKENNNIFGMKQATKRINVSNGTQYDHAFYSNWQDSLYDYGLYYATYLSRLTTEAEYFNFLSEYYAQDPQYVVKLKEIIIKEELKSLFN